MSDRIDSTFRNAFSWLGAASIIGVGVFIVIVVILGIILAFTQ